MAMYRWSYRWSKLGCGRDEPVEHRPQPLGGLEGHHQAHVTSLVADQLDPGLVGVGPAHETGQHGARHRQVVGLERGATGDHADAAYRALMVLVVGVPPAVVDAAAPGRAPAGRLGVVVVAHAAPIGRT